MGKSSKFKNVGKPSRGKNIITGQSFTQITDTEQLSEMKKYPVFITL
jgi:hypothetical protein